MTITVWPVDAVSGAPSYTGRMLRQTNTVAFAGATSARPLGARSGVRPGTPSTTVTTTSTTFTINPHAGLLDLETALQASAYAYSIDAALSGSVTAANVSNPRIDIIYLQLNDPAESDGSSTPGLSGTNYLAGTAAGSPSPPATPARAMVLAQINVPTSGGGSPTVTWVAPTCVAAGGILPVRSAAEETALSLYPGKAWFRTDLGVPRFSDDGTRKLSTPRQPLYSAKYYRAAALTLSSGGRTAIPVDTQVYDFGSPNAMFSAGICTVQEDGLYRISFRVASGVNINPQDFYGLIVVPGFTSELIYGSRVLQRGVTTADPIASVGSDELFFTAGQQFELAAFNGGGNPMTLTVGQLQTWITVSKVG